MLSDYIECLIHVETESLKKQFKKTTERTAQKSVLQIMKYKDNIYISKTKKRLKMKSYLQTVTFATIKNNVNGLQHLLLTSPSAKSLQQKRMSCISKVDNNV